MTSSAPNFFADPAATAALLPERLTPDPETNGHAALMFVDWQFTASNDEYLDPARYQYREAFVTINARWGEMKVNFCPFIYVDNDAAMVRGWTQGFPKQLGSIFQTRTFAAPSPAMALVEPGGRFAGSVSCHGQRLADVKVTLQQTEADPTTLFNRPSAQLRYFPRLEKDKLDKPAVNELTLSITDNLQIVDLWTGAAEISFPDVPNEELSALKPVKVGARLPVQPGLFGHRPANSEGLYHLTEYRNGLVMATSLAGPELRPNSSDTPVQ